jgi:transcriptional regulator with XRE-family HTH domain
MPHADSPVAAAVRAELARRNISGRQLGRDLGWYPNYVSRRTSGAVEFRVDELHRVADYLGIPVGALLDPAPTAPLPADPTPARAS